MLRTVFSFIERTNEVKSTDELAKLFSREIAKLGFSHSVCGALTRPDRYASGSPLILGGFPPEWTAHYFQAGYDKIDPVIKFASQNTLPFRWSQLRLSDQRQATILREASEIGMHDGVVIPIHGPENDLFCVSLATEDPVAAAQAPLDGLRLMVVQLQSTLLRLLAETPNFDEGPKLTAREADCLTYCAIGKTSWEIGQILNISAKTVDFHLANAMAKLDATTRILAVVKALRRGVIAI
jgi:DNA-binding CsgD family transcriptional regulator